MLRTIRRLVGFRRRLARADGGATAVEFGLIAAPFFFMMFCLLEVGHLFVLSSTLENATMEASRRIRTGEVQLSGGTAATFKTQLCARMSVFQSQCQSNLTIDVRVLNQFADGAPDPMANGTTFNTSSLGFVPGGPENIVLVRAWWRQPLFVPLMNQGLSRLRDGKAVLTSAAAFRNEPYNPTPGQT